MTCLTFSASTGPWGLASPIFGRSNAHLGAQLWPLRPCESPPCLALLKVVLYLTVEGGALSRRPALPESTFRVVPGVPDGYGNPFYLRASCAY